MKRFANRLGGSLAAVGLFAIIGGRIGIADGNPGAEKTLTMGYALVVAGVLLVLAAWSFERIVAWSTRR